MISCYSFCLGKTLLVIPVEKVRQPVFDAVRRRKRAQPSCYSHDFVNIIHLFTANGERSGWKFDHLVGQGMFKMASNRDKPNFLHNFFYLRAVCKSIIDQVYIF